MKVTIDNKAKTIQVEEDGNLWEFFNFLKEMGIDFKEYTLVANTGVQYVPYYTGDWTYPVYNPPVFPTWVVTCDINNSNLK